MKNKKLSVIFFLLAGLLLTVFTAGCSPSEEISPTLTTRETATTLSESVSQTVTITDASGREITIDLPIERVCYLHPAIAEGLRIVDAWDRVITKDNYTLDSIIFPGIEDMQELPYSYTGQINYEQILELQPDVLLVLPAAGSIDLEEAIAILEPEIPVVSVFDTSDADTWAKGVELLGTIMQQEAEAQEYITFIHNIEDRITSRTADLSEAEKPNVFLKVSGRSIEQLSSLSNEYGFVEKMMKVIGAINIAADLPSMGGWVQDVDPEWLMTQEYDYILVEINRIYYPDAMGVGVQDTALTQTIHNDLLNMTEFEESKAIADDNLYMMDNELIKSIRFPIGLAYSAKAMHPELFSDLDPRAIMQEYLTRFIRIDYDTSKSGVFCYPEP
jgi:iron complex transport system substrate-binding protein